MKILSIKTVKSSWYVILFLLTCHFSFSQDLKVQHLQADVSRNGHVSHALTPIASLSKAFAIPNNNRLSQAGVPGSASNMSGRDMSGAIRLTNTSSLEYYRDLNSINANTKFSSSIIEYKGPSGGPNEFVVRGRYAISLNGNQNSKSQTINGVTNTNKCIPFITGIINSSNNSDADSGTALAYLESNSSMRVRKGSIANNVTVYITLVEFIGTNWNVLHGDSDNTATDTGTLTLRTNANGTGTAANVPNWNKAIIFGQHIGDFSTDGTNDAIADNWPIFRPGNNNQQVNWEFNENHDSNGHNKHFVHVLINGNLNVTRFQNTSNTDNETAFNISSAGLSNMNQSMIVGASISNGTGTAYGRGWRNYYLKSITQAAHWAHRSGNNMIHEVQIVDFTDLQSLNCNATVNSFPYTENFESNIGLWSQTGSDDIDWSRRNGNTPSSSTGPSNAASGSYYLYTEASSGNDGKTAILESPCFDLTSNVNPQFSFKYHMYGQNMGNLYVDLSSNGSDYPVTVWSQIGQGANQNSNYKPWNLVDLDLSAYAGQSIRLRFRGETGNGYASDMAIDQISFIDVPPVPEMNVKGNAITISNGTGTANVADGTNYGSHDVGVPVTHTFVIENLGNGPLDISSITLSNYIDFSLVAPTYDTSVLPSGSTNLNIKFNCLSNSIKSSWVTIETNDPQQGSFTFFIKGESKQLFFDSDNDGVFDNVDADDDNDGIPDSVEELDCQNSNISIKSNYKILNETFGTGGRTTINTTYNAITTYAYEDGTNPSNIDGSNLGDGEYTVFHQTSNGNGNNNTPSEDIASWAESNWYIGGDHTPDDTNGRMALFNASYDPGVFYTAHISGVLPDVPTTYSFWVLNLVPVSGVESDRAPDILVEFRDVNNNLLHSFSTGKIPKSINYNPDASWHNFTSQLVFDVSEFNVYFINNETGGNGNDLAIDDISFTQSLCDTDGDGIANIFDLDSDNDGIPDSVEAGFADATDGKAFIQNFTDADENGMHDPMEGLTILDTDGDGTPNYIDLDSDNDSIYDVDESGAGNTNDTAFQNGDGDIDGDGVGDGPDSDTTRETDSNYDGVSEFFTDGILDIYDFHSGTTYASGYGNTNQGVGNLHFVRDTDNDGIPDYMDTMSDGVNYDISKTLFAELDTNNDGILDDTADSDADGIVNSFDNDSNKFGSPKMMDKKLLIYFDGRNDFVEDTPIFGGSQEASMMGWIRIDPAASGNQMIFGQERIHLMFRNSNRIYARVNSAIIQSEPMPKNQWMHVAMSYSAITGKFTLYVNGSEAITTTVSGAVDADNTPFTMGKRAASNTNYFNGCMDEVRLFNKALSADEIQKMVYQEIENNSGTVRGAVIPRDVTNFMDPNNSTALEWNSLERYFRFDDYRGDIVDDLSTPSIDVGTGAKMHNIKILEVQSAPMPFVTQQSGDLETALSIPSQGVIGADAIKYDWSIVHIKHNDVSFNSRQKHVGLLIDELDANANPIEFSVKEDSEINVSWYLKLDGFMDLEGEAQLIQGLDSYLDPSSKGHIERDQQGTADTFTYNYWSSPVGTQNSTSNNNGFTLNAGIKDGSNPATPNSINFVNSYNGSSGNPIGISKRWLYKYNNLPDGNYSDWAAINPNTPLLTGEGYTMKGPGTGGITAPQNYVFNGKPNNGDINLPLNAGNDYLIGNPYPSALDAVQFILDNGPTISGSEARITGTLYFWEHWGGGSHNLSDYQGGYATFNLSGSTPSASYGSSDPDVSNQGVGTKLSGRFIPVSQGFFVVGETNGLINFNNGQRAFQKETSGNSVFFRNSSDTPNSDSSADADDNAYADTRMKFRIGFNSVGTIHRQLLLTIDDNATPGIDWGYDGKHNDAQIDDMFWMIADESYNIQASNAIEENTSFPLGIHTHVEGLNTIKIDALENVPNDIDIYIHDLENDSYHDLRNSDFEFELAAGDHFSKFELSFGTSDNETLHTNTTAENTIDVFYSNASKSIVLVNPDLIKVTSIAVLNLLGQRLLQIEDLSELDYSEYQVKSLSAGTYIITMETESGSISKKVLVN